MSCILFLAFVVVMAAFVTTLAGRYLDRRVAYGVAIGLAVWCIYAGLLGYSGVLKNTSMRPPGIVFLGGPVLIFLSLFVIWGF